MKKIKRTLSLMILAGMLTVGLASCVVRGNGEGSGEIPTGTETIIIESSITTAEEPNPNVPSTDPTLVSYTAVDDVVYVSAASASLKLASDVTQTKNLSQLTELHRIGKSTNWCKVEYDGAEYYIQTKTITTDDIGEKTFTALETPQTLYNIGTVNVRKYASSDNNFSDKLATTGEAAIPVTVIAQSQLKGWSKVRVTIDGVEYTGFMSTKYLTPNASGEADDFDQHFEVLTTGTKMYVSVGKVAVRARPYADGEEKGVLEKNTEVTVVGKGTVEGMDWCAIEYQEGPLWVNYFIASDCLSVVGGDLDQLLKFYEELVKFDEPKTLYISTDKANIRSTPAIRDDNYAGVLTKKTEVKAVAMGVFVQEGGSSSQTWCLIEDNNGGYCFVSYSVLTSDPEGTPAPAVTDVNVLIDQYGFTKVTDDVSMRFKVNDSGIYGDPTPSSEFKKLAQGTVVKVIAEGKTVTHFGTVNKWYIVEYNSYYYFVPQAVLENV